MRLDTWPFPEPNRGRVMPFYVPKNRPHQRGTTSDAVFLINGQCIVSATCFILSSVI